MKAISLWQPWASAIALNYKTIETRARRTYYRGEVAIHAAKRIECVKQMDFEELSHLPLGAIVCVATIYDCLPTDQIVTTELEKVWGNFTPGRFGWFLQNIRPLTIPIPTRGFQGFWDLPAHVARAVCAELPL